MQFINKSEARLKMTLGLKFSNMSHLIQNW